MKIAELRKLKAADLKKRLIESRKEIMALRFQKAAGELADTSAMLKLKKTIARIKTLANENSQEVK